MKHKYLALGGIAVVSVLALTGCGGGEEQSDGGSTDGTVDLTLSGWSIDTTPEFQALVDGFEAENPDVNIELKEYDAAEYNTLVTADLAAGVGPDLITQKEVKYVTTFQEGGQLLDVSDVALPDGISGADSYTVDGTAYAVPYRNDSWVIFYNKALFDAAGVDYPDGSWTWDDYDAAAEKLTTAESKGSYMHNWQSVVQGFANAQSDVSVLEGSYDHLAPYYDRVLALQDSGAQIDYNTAKANQLTYQGEFGGQSAAMMPMGTWYVASLIAQQASGEAEDFEWGIAPAPQLDASTAGTDNVPVTFGDPTGIGINAALDSSKVQAAKDFLAYAAGEEGATILAGIGITPALLTDAITEKYFSVDGAPSDDLSKFAFSTHKVLAENPTSSKTAAIQGILGDLHSAVMSESEDVDSAVKAAEDRVANEVGLD